MIRHNFIGIIIIGIILFPVLQDLYGTAVTTILFLTTNSTVLLIPQSCKYRDQSRCLRELQQLMEDEQKPLSKTRFSVRVALWLKKKRFFGRKKLGHRRLGTSAYTSRRGWLPQQTLKASRGKCCHNQRQVANGMKSFMAKTRRNLGNFFQNFNR